MIGKAASAASVAVVVAIVLGLRQVGYEEAGRRIAPLGWAAPIVAAVVLSMLVVVPGVPSDLFGVVNGSLFGPVMGALVNWVGALVGSTICYAIGHRLGEHPWVAGLIARLPQRMRWGVGSLPFLLCVRYLPAVGGTTVNYAAGAMKVSIGRFLWTAAIGTLPPAWFWATVGYASRG